MGQLGEQILFGHKKKKMREETRAVCVCCIRSYGPYPIFNTEKRIGTSFNLVCSYGHPAEKGFDILPIKKRKPNDFG